MKISSKDKKLPCVRPQKNACQEIEERKVKKIEVELLVKKKNQLSTSARQEIDPK